MSNKDDNLYARAWECDSKTPIFDAKKNNVTPPNSPEIAVRSDLSNEKSCNTPRTSREHSPEILTQTEDLCDVTYAYPYMERDAEISSEKSNPSPINPRSSKYKLRQGPKLRSLIATTITDNNYCAALVCSTGRICKRSRTFWNTLWNH